MLWYSWQLLWKYRFSKVFITVDLGSCICLLILEQLWWRVLMQTAFSQSTALMSILLPLVKKQGADWAMSVLEVITSHSQPSLLPAICFCPWPMCCQQGHHASPALIDIQLDWGLAPVVWLWCIVLLSQSYGLTKQHPAIYTYVCVTPLSVDISHGIGLAELRFQRFEGVVVKWQHIALVVFFYIWRCLQISCRQWWDPFKFHVR